MSGGGWPINIAVCRERSATDARTTKATAMTTGASLDKVFHLDKAAWTPAETTRVGRRLRRNT
jgi:hypothetical protein